MTASLLAKFRLDGQVAVITGGARASAVPRPSFSLPLEHAP
jgi:hypothetical protein